MTDPMLPADDEIVSAVLDGEATDGERARADADPTAGERLARFADVARLVGAPVPVDPELREQAIARALDTFDVSAGTSTPERADRPPDELAVRRARRSARIGPVLAAVAAVVVVLIGVGAVLRSTGPTDTLATGSMAADSTTEPREATARGGGADDDLTRPDPQDASPPVAASEQSPTTTAMASASDVPGATTDAGTPPVTVFGEVDSPDQLRRLVLGVVTDRRPMPTTASTTAPGSPDQNRSTSTFAGTCETPARQSDAELGPTVVVGTATFEGRAASVYAFAIDRTVHPAANGSLRIYALDAQDCATLSVQTVR